MTGKADPYGRDAARPYHIPLKGWRQVAERVWAESSRDNLSVIAAGCAFYALFAIFPGLSALISLYGLTADPITIEQQLGGLASVLPGEAYNLVIEQVHRLAEASGKLLGWSLGVSLVLSVWSVMSLTQALFAALNIAYEEPERRNMLRYYLNAFIFALLGIIGAVIVLLAIVYVPIVFAYAGYSQQFELIVRVARWPLLTLLVLALLALLYRYGPCRHTAKWQWVSVGSVFATSVWLFASAGFSFYVANFAHYDATYGSLGAVIDASLLALSLLLHRAARRRAQRRARAADCARHHEREAEAERATGRLCRRSCGGRCAGREAARKRGYGRSSSGQAWRCLTAYS